MEKENNKVEEESQLTENDKEIKGFGKNIAPVKLKAPDVKFFGEVEEDEDNE